MSRGVGVGSSQLPAQCSGWPSPLPLGCARNNTETGELALNQLLLNHRNSLSQGMAEPGGDRSPGWDTAGPKSPALLCFHPPPCVQTGHSGENSSKLSCESGLTGAASGTRAGKSLWHPVPLGCGDSTHLHRNDRQDLHQDAIELIEAAPGACLGKSFVDVPTGLERNRAVGQSSGTAIPHSSRSGGFGDKTQSAESCSCFMDCDLP